MQGFTHSVRYLYLQLPEIGKRSRCIHCILLFLLNIIIIIQNNLQSHASTATLQDNANGEECEEPTETEELMEKGTYEYVIKINVTFGG